MGFLKISSTEIIKLLTLLKKMIRFIGYLACMGEKRNTYKVLVENLLGRDKSDDLGISDRVILKWISEVCGLDSSEMNMVL